MKNYTKFADPDNKETNHGGIVAYVHESLSSHVFDVSYKTCFLALRIDLIPQFSFIGAYIQPESSPYFTSTMFCDLSSYIMTIRERSSIPVVGGEVILIVVLVI